MMYDALPRDNKTWLNLENFEYHSLFRDLSTLTVFLRSQYVGEGILYLFLDEFQKIKKIDTILKLIYDELPWVKVIASGSNSIEINKNIHESFAGRKRVYTMYPLDFDEFLLWRGEVSHIGEIDKYYDNPLHTNKLASYLEEFMIWWGYPEVVLAADTRERQKVLEGIFDYWFNRDIVLYTDRLTEFKELFRQLAFRMGNTLSYAELGTLTHLTWPTIKRFVAILEEIYICFQVVPFFHNKLKELSRAPKLYFYDPGCRNIFIRRFDFSPSEFGSLFENFIFTELMKRWKHKSDLKFWRTKNEQYEVDVIIEHEERAIECKYRESIKSEDSRWIRAFQKENPRFWEEYAYIHNFWKIWQ
jgi:predicted AAA+ superfamily ATPase